MLGIDSDDSVHDRPDLPSKQLQEAKRLKMVAGVEEEEVERSTVVVGVEGEGEGEGEGSKMAKPRQKGVITKEDLAMIKLKACAICGIADDHPQSRCPLRQACPSNKIVGPNAEIVCWCCEEDPAIAHPNRLVIGRARLKESIFENSRILPCRRALAALSTNNIFSNF